jgi:hypothetical protein
LEWWLGCGGALDIRCHWLRRGDEELELELELQVLTFPLPGVVAALLLLLLLLFDHCGKVLGVEAACGSVLRVVGAASKSCWVLAWVWM